MSARARDLVYMAAFVVLAAVALTTTVWPFNVLALVVVLVGVVGRAAFLVHRYEMQDRR